MMLSIRNARAQLGPLLTIILLLLTQHAQSSLLPIATSNGAQQYSHNTSHVIFEGFSNNASSEVETTTALIALQGQPSNRAEVCQICWCSKPFELDCRYRNDHSSSIEKIPTLSRVDERNRIVDIIASFQPYLKRLDQSQMAPYSKLVKLIIEHSALEIIERDTFSNNAYLKEISIKNNQLRTLSWRHFDGLSLLDLSLENNPLECTCATVKWIQHVVSQRHNILGPYWANVTCVDQGGRLQTINNLTVTDCAFPMIRAEPREIKVKEGDPLVITCEATGKPDPLIQWNTTSLNSNYSLVKEQVIFDQNNQDLVKVSQVLRIDRTTVDDNADIVCVAENDVGKAYTTVMISVFSAPKIVSFGLQSKFHKNIVYAVKGYPLANTTWYKDGVLIEDNANLTVSYEYPHRASIIGSIEIIKKTTAANGEYKLVATNLYGSDAKSLTFVLHQEIMNPKSHPPGSDQHYLITSTDRSMAAGGSDDDSRGVLSLHEGSWMTLLFKRFIIAASILIALVLVGFIIYWMQFSWKKPVDNTIGSQQQHGSWESSIDGNSSQLRMPQSYPLRLVTTVQSWLNRKKRLIRARRHRMQSSNRLQNLPASRATFYYNNGRQLIQTGSAQSRVSATSRSESEAMAALLQCNRAPIASLVSNPNYFNETELLLKNTAICHIRNEKISFIKELGEGAFGRVFLGTVDYLTEEDPTTMVAIKVLKESSCADLREEFSREAEFLANLVHKNIVTFYGISMDGPHLMMIFEYMEYGDLNNFLRERDPFSSLATCTSNSSRTGGNSQTSAVTVTTNTTTSTSSTTSHYHSNRRRETPLQLMDLLYIATQISAGMEYLASQRFVHRDLATRNCLVGLDLVTKIGDFGMSRDIYATDYYRVGRDVMLPIRWMSPESIMYRKYTVESDCWSFGILLWEVLTYAKQPWYEYTNPEVIQNVTRGKLLAPPERCPSELYQLMLDCWCYKPSERISIPKVHEQLTTLLKRVQEGYQPELVPTHTPSPSPPPVPEQAQVHHSPSTNPSSTKDAYLELSHH